AHMNKTVAETMHANMEKVGLPTWTEADQTLAKAVQREMKVPETGLATKLGPLRGRESIPDEEKRGGGSDDIGDISAEYRTRDWVGRFDTSYKVPVVMRPGQVIVFNKYLPHGSSANVAVNETRMAYQIGYNVPGLKGGESRDLKPLLRGEEEIAHATQPTLRLLIQPKRTSSTVLTDTSSSWTLCTPETARNFSAIAYFFGREISAAEKVPIGLIDSTWGGTPVHSWLSLDSI
ncbi:hypothetical protein B4Q13_18725, partial [Lacticaseibacillus rhamnosus]